MIAPPNVPNILRQASRAACGRPARQPAGVVGAAAGEQIAPSRPTSNTTPARRPDTSGAAIVSVPKNQQNLYRPLSRDDGFFFCETRQHSSYERAACPERRGTHGCRRRGPRLDTSRLQPGRRRSGVGQQRQAEGCQQGLTPRASTKQPSIHPKVSEAPASRRDLLRPAYAAAARSHTDGVNRSSSPVRERMAFSRPADRAAERRPSPAHNCSRGRGPDRAEALRDDQVVRLSRRRILAVPRERPGEHEYDDRPAGAVVRPVPRGPCFMETWRGRKRSRAPPTQPAGTPLSPCRGVSDGAPSRHDKPIFQ